VKIDALLEKCLSCSEAVLTQQTCLTPREVLDFLALLEQEATTQNDETT